MSGAGLQHGVGFGCILQRDDGEALDKLPHLGHFLCFVLGVVGSEHQFVERDDRKAATPFAEAYQLAGDVPVAAQQGDADVGVEQVVIHRTRGGCDA